MSVAAAPRKVTEVAVGVLLRPDGAVLLADRPPGKPYAGYWEFPGGKIEAGETVEHGLARELHEELGIDIGPVMPWVTFEFDYPHAYVRLHFCRVHDWRGTPVSREGQNLAFFRLGETMPTPLLPAAVPALRWLTLPALAAEAELNASSAAQLPARAEAAFAQGLRLLVLRGGAAAAGRTDDVARLMAALRARAQACGARVLVDAGLAAPHEPVDGVFLSDSAVRRATVRPAGGWIGADADARPAVEQAARLGCDFVVAGPVFPAAGAAAAAPAIGWHGFSALARQAPLPVYARGGLGFEDLDRARVAGAHGLLLPLADWIERRPGPHGGGHGCDA